MNEITLDAYLRFALTYTVTLWAAYAVYLVLCLWGRKTHLRSFAVALVCWLLLSEECFRVSLMVEGVFSESLKPNWLTLLMNLPFVVIIYEILFRKAGVSVLDAWKNVTARRRGVKPRHEHDGVHSAVRRPGRSASDHQWTD